MAWPLAPDHPDEGDRLRQAFEAAEKAASDAYAAAVARRDQIEAKGEVGQKELAEVKRLRDEYEQAATTAEKARAAYMAHLDARHGGTKDVPGGWPEGIGKAWIENVGAKALDVTSGGTAVGPMYDPRIRSLPQRQLFVRTLIPVQQADSDKIWYVRHTAYDNQAAPVAAGALKPTSTISIERVEEPVRTIAHLSEAVDRSLLMDFEELTRFLDGQLRLGVLLAEEAQILNGNGAAPNLRGILNTSGILTQARGTDPHVDAVAKAIFKLRGHTNPSEPTGVVLNPTDLQTILLSRDANQNYQAADAGAVQTDFDGTVRLWGKPVIASPVMPQGTGLVGDFTAATVWDREQARVTFAEQGGLGAGGAEIFSRNQIVFRAEERIAFGVERPAAFCTVTGL